MRNASVHASTALALPKPESAIDVLRDARKLRSRYAPSDEHVPDLAAAGAMLGDETQRSQRGHAARARRGHAHLCAVGVELPKTEFEFELDFLAVYGALAEIQQQRLE